jgi:hypothetical protein
VSKQYTQEGVNHDDRHFPEQAPADGFERLILKPCATADKR